MMDCDPPAGEEGAKRRSAQKLIERWILQKNGRISRDFPEKADKVSLAGTTTNWPLGAVKSARTPIAPPVQPLFLQMKRQPRLSTSSKYICLQHLLVMMMLSSTCPIILLFPDPSSFVSETRGRGYGCGRGGDTDLIVPLKLNLVQYQCFSRCRRVQAQQLLVRWQFQAPRPHLRAAPESKVSLFDGDHNIHRSTLKTP